MKKILTLLLGLAMPALAQAWNWNPNAVTLAMPKWTWNTDPWHGDINVSAGYRNDRIETTIKAFDPPGTLINVDKLKGKDINIFEVGINGRVTYCDQAFIRGYANFGWVCDGRYTETSGFPLIFSSVTKGKIHSGHTRDYSIGVGYLFSCWNCFKIGPAVGYSYDFQKIKLGNNVTTNGEPSPTLNHLSYDMKWQGPWLGAEAQFCVQCVQVNVGYEYHWSDWRANWTLAGPDVIDIAFSDKRRSNNAHGNVVFLEGNYVFCSCWTVGLGFKYQQWTVRRGCEKPRAGSFAAIGLSPTEHDKVTHVCWRSAQVHVSLGYLF